MNLAKSNHPVLFETKWVKIRQSPKGHQYLERRGRDSIAILLVRIGENGNPEALIRHQYLCVSDNDDDVFACPITGSIEEDEDPRDTAAREAFEEAGYAVELHKTCYIGKYIASTQANETVYLYVSNVTGMEPTEPKGDGGYHESISKNVWSDWSEVVSADYVGLKVFSAEAYQSDIRFLLGIDDGADIC